MQNETNWLFFNAAMKSEWETQVMRDIEETTGRKISVTLTLPTEAKARECWEKNRDLQGRLTLTEDGQSRSFKLLFPFEGVFIRRSSATGHAQLLTWATWLGERPGEWLIAPASHVRRENGLVDLCVAKNCSSWKLELKKTANGTYEVLDSEKCSKFIQDTSFADNQDKLLEKVKSLTLYDQDDLTSHRKVFTFPVWLACRIRWMYEQSADQKQDVESPGWLLPVRILLQKGIFTLVQPNNALELAARIWGVKRFFYSRDNVLHYPPEYRQNHPSFRGRICPIETPESELVGLALQIARGARVNAEGEIIPAPDEASSLGWGVSLIPHLAHNDGARNMLGAKNLRQAVPVAGREVPLVSSGAERALADQMAPLARIGICSSSFKDNQLTLGRNLLVAYLPWKGWNVDDAIVVRKGIVADMTIPERKRLIRRIAPGFKLVWSTCLKEGASLKMGDVVAEFEDFKGRRTVICYEDVRPAILVRAPLLQEMPSQSLEQQIVFEIEQQIPLAVGDKLMGRHGNKGVVSKILAEDEMPHLPDGTPVDILLNSHGVLSRMNPGQLLETQEGWATKKGNSADVDNKIYLRLPDSKEGDETWTATPVFVGYEYIVRLHHVPSLKAAARRGGVSARYDAATQQAVHGRAAGGGQRLGEMEVWALAAYDVPHVLEEMLGAKADRLWAMRSPIGEAPEQGEMFSGFAQTLKDWLFALSLDLCVNSDGQVRVNFLSDPEEVKGRIGKGQQVTSSAGYEKVRLAQFGCHDAKRKIWYDLSGYYPVKDKSLRVDAYLTELGYDCSRPIEPAPDGVPDHYRWNLTSNVDNVWVDVFLRRYDPDKTTLTVEIKPQPQPACRPQNWPAEILICMGNGNASTDDSEAEKRGKKLSAKGLLKQITDVHGRIKIGSFKMCCPDYPSKLLAAYGPFRTRLKTEKGSVFDEQIFGPWAAAGSGNDRWGYIDLPEQVEVPYVPSKKWTQFKKVHGLEKEVNAQAATIKLSVIPVLPIRCRLPYALRQEVGKDQEDEKTKAWVERVNACYQNICRLKGDINDPKGQKRQATKKEIEETVSVLFSCLAERLEKKEGVLRRDGLGRRVDRSFRLVITPNPDLEWDEAGVPVDVLWEVMGDCVAAWEKSESRESCQLAPKREQAIRTTWQHTERIPFTDQYRRLTAYLEAHRDTVILLNRQPSLHRESIQAFHPIPLDPTVGDVLQISPLCCKGFAADFDGDEMVGHYPVSLAAQQEAQELLPSSNLFSLDSGKSTVQYDRDLVSGLQLIYELREDLKTELGALLPEACCRAVFEQPHQPGAFGQQLIQHLCEKHPKEAVAILSALARLAYAMCTLQGMSFSFQDLKVLVQKSCTDQASVEQALQKLTKEELEQAPGLANICTMVLSGANGKKQIHQIVGQRGRLETGPLGYDLSQKDQEKQFSFMCSLVGGMSWDDVFNSSWNARSTMCDKKLGTGKAGDLTRRLVFLLWPRFGTEGLLAAQAIGERGTQVAMQGFHTGSRSIDIQQARRLLLRGCQEKGDDYVKNDDITGFLAAIKKNDEYAKVKEEHFRLLFEALKDVRKKGGSSLAKKLWTRLFQRDSLLNLLCLAFSRVTLSINELPFTRLLFNAFGSREGIGFNQKKGE